MTQNSVFFGWTGTRWIEILKIRDSRMRSSSQLTKRSNENGNQTRNIKQPLGNRCSRRQHAVAARLENVQVWPDGHAWNNDILDRASEHHCLVAIAKTKRCTRRITQWICPDKVID